MTYIDTPDGPMPEYVAEVVRDQIGNVIDVTTENQNAAQFAAQRAGQDLSVQRLAPVQRANGSAHRTPDYQGVTAGETAVSQPQSGTATFEQVSAMQEYRDYLEKQRQLFDAALAILDKHFKVPPSIEYVNGWLCYFCHKASAETDWHHDWIGYEDQWTCPRCDARQNQPDDCRICEACDQVIEEGEEAKHDMGGCQ